MSVDTYLKRKNLAPYRRVEQEGVRVLVAPILATQARRITLDVRRRLLWTSLTAEIEARGDHFHSPACSH